MTGNRERYFANGKGNQEMGCKGRREGEGDVKRVKMCYVHLPPPQEECNHELQTCTSKKKLLKRERKEGNFICLAHQEWSGHQILGALTNGTKIKILSLPSESLFFSSCHFCNTFCELKIKELALISSSLLMWHALLLVVCKG